MKRWLAAALGAALAWSATASAQTLESAQIRGVVYDQTKAALPGATVTLTNAATGFTRTVATNADGAYNFAQVPIGTYGMNAELSGFAPTQVTGLVLNAGGAVTYDITMGLAGQKEAVMVEASGAAIDTSSAGVSQLINEQAIANLPLSGRDFRDHRRLLARFASLQCRRLGLDQPAQRAREVRLAEHLANVRDVTVRVVGLRRPLILFGRLALAHQETVEEGVHRKAVGELDRGLQHLIEMHRPLGLEGDRHRVEHRRHRRAERTVARHETLRREQRGGRRLRRRTLAVDDDDLLRLRVVDHRRRFAAETEVRDLADRSRKH